jgi:hypothetical protein
MAHGSARIADRTAERHGEKITLHEVQFFDGHTPEKGSQLFVRQNTHLEGSDQALDARLTAQLFIDGKGFTHTPLECRWSAAISPKTSIRK